MSAAQRRRRVDDPHLERLLDDFHAKAFRHLFPSSTVRPNVQHMTDLRGAFSDGAAALAEALSTLLNDPARRARMRARLLERAPAHTWDARAARLLQWMQSRAVDR